LLFGVVEDENEAVQKHADDVGGQHHFDRQDVLEAGETPESAGEIEDLEVGCMIRRTLNG
jgi:hypothetical protein